MCAGGTRGAGARTERKALLNVGERRRVNVMLGRVEIGLMMTSCNKIAGGSGYRHSAGSLLVTTPLSANGDTGEHSAVLNGKLSEDVDVEMQDVWCAHTYVAKRDITLPEFRTGGLPRDAATDHVRRDAGRGGRSAPCARIDDEPSSPYEHRQMQSQAACVTTNDSTLRHARQVYI